MTTAKYATYFIHLDENPMNNEHRRETPDVELISGGDKETKHTDTQTLRGMNKMTNEESRKDKAKKATDKFIDEYYQKRGTSEEDIEKMKKGFKDYYDKTKDPDFREEVRRKLKDQGENV